MIENKEAGLVLIATIWGGADCGSFLVWAPFSNDRTVELGSPPRLAGKLAPLAVGPGVCIIVILCGGLIHQPAPEIDLLGASDAYHPPGWLIRPDPG